MWSLRTDDPEVAARRVKEQRQRNIAARIYGDDRTKWEEAVVSWAENYIPETDIGPETAKRYKCSLKQMNEWLCDKYVDEIDKRLIDEIVTIRRRRKGIAIASIRRDLTALSSVLTHCQVKNWRDGNPALDRLRLIKERKEPIVLPEHPYIDMVIAQAPGMIGAIVKTAIATGCRLEELVKAKRSSLDLRRKELTIIGKGNKRRVIDLTYGGGYEVLSSLPIYAGSDWVFWHDRGEPYKNLSSRFSNLVRDVFVTAYDAKHGTTARTRPPLKQLVRDQRKLDWVDIGFRTFRFHDLRHLHAVEYVRHGNSIFDLQGRLGHASITMTERYREFFTPQEWRASMHGRSKQHPRLELVSG